jgi:hypothetical protein
MILQNLEAEKQELEKSEKIKEEEKE